MLRFPWLVGFSITFASLLTTGHLALPALSNPSVPNVRFALHLDKNKVAAGGVRNAAHQALFTLRLTNAQGEPLVGVPVDLPTLWNEQGPISTEKAKPGSPAPPKVEWHTRTTLVNKQAVTDKDGVAVGLYTSGQGSSKVKLRAGSAEASIQQVWNEDKVPWNHPPFLRRNEPNLVQYEMSYWPGDEQVPGKNQVMITGHNLTLHLKSVTFEAFLLTGGVDENGVLNTDNDLHEWTVHRPDPQTASAQEKALWATILLWSKIEGMRETAPGIYQGSYFVELPEKPTILNGRWLHDISNVAHSVQDEDVWETQ